MRLEELSIMHQTAHLFTCWSKVFWANTNDYIKSFCSRQVVRHRADTTKALHEHWNLPIGTALDKALEASELDDVQASLGNLFVVVEQDGHFAVTLYAGYWLDGDFICRSFHCIPPLPISRT